MFDNRVLRRIFEPKREEVPGGLKNDTIRSFISCTVRRILFGYRINVEEIERWNISTHGKRQKWKQICSRTTRKDGTFQIQPKHR
jgi:hypothetical protein